MPGDFSLDSSRLQVTIIDTAQKKTKFSITTENHRTEGGAARARGEGQWPWPLIKGTRFF